jgi:two-component sensor histidine kinase
MRILLTTGLALAGGLLLMLVSGILTGNVGSADWWRWNPKYHLLICLCVGYTILALLWAAERLLPARLNDGVLLLNVLVMAGTLAGYAIALNLIEWLYVGYPAWRKAAVPLAQTRFVAFVIVVVATTWIGVRMRTRRRALRSMVTESQLRLLQAQIEPHFLFNTLANVQSLIDYDPKRAKRMLEGFIWYLRSGLDQLREAESTLEAELQKAENYLQLLQIRMEDRLTFAIHASEEARQIRLPTLLLQPLIENAVKHGLEPKIEGGHVSVNAHLEQGMLTVNIDDNGMGLAAASGLRRGGNGLAIANIRARLRTRYGAHATLSLLPREAGTRASLVLPAR